MKSETRTHQKAVLTCEEMIQSEPGTPITKRRLIDYDLSPLRDIIESGGIEELINAFKTLHDDIVTSSLMSFSQGKYGIFENNPDLVNQLFYIKTVAECFDEIRMETYQLKNYPVEELEKI